MLGFGSVADAPVAAEAFAVTIPPQPPGADLAALTLRVEQLEARLNAMLAAGLVRYDSGKFKVYS